MAEEQKKQNTQKENSFPIITNYIFMHFSLDYILANLCQFQKKVKKQILAIIQYWGSKGNRLERKDFTYIQDYVFMALIAKTDIDFIALDKGEISADEAVSDLIETMESYTNYGLTMIHENIEENPNYFQKQTAFLDLMLNGK
ncbi:MAG: hypothetical protein U5L09_13415 [Bacteroidales bacterium]|nr:hypothetical protein [Bacteroidales bacterium]